MASTSAQTAPLTAGYTSLPGLQVSPGGGVLTNLKVYNFSLSTAMTCLGTDTSTAVVSTRLSEFVYTVSGLTTADIVLGLSAASTTPLNPITTSSTDSGVVIAGARITSTAGLAITFARVGTSTGAAVTVGPTPMTLITYSYYAQSSSTST